VFDSNYCPFKSSLPQLHKSLLGQRTHKVQGLLPETLLDLAQCRTAIERVEDRLGLMSDGGDTIVTQQHITKGLGARSEMAHRIGPLVEYQFFRRIPISSTFERVESKRAWLYSPDSFVPSTQCMI
jgi:hypothetical protein